MKKYALTVTLGISAKDEEDARKKLVKIIEGSSYITLEGKYYAIAITDPEGIRVREIEGEAI